MHIIIPWSHSPQYSTSWFAQYVYCGKLQWEGRRACGEIKINPEQSILFLNNNKKKKIFYDGESGVKNMIG